MRPAASSRRRAPAGKHPSRANPTAPHLRRRLRADHTLNRTPGLRLRCSGAMRHLNTKDNMADDLSLNPSRDDFSALLEESLGGRDLMEGQVVHGKVVAIEK